MKTDRKISLSALKTEQSNSAAPDLDRRSALEIARLINAEDSTVASAVQRVLPQIARAIDLVAAALRKGGRLFMSAPERAAESARWMRLNARPHSIPIACASSLPEARRL